MTSRQIGRLAGRWVTLARRVQPHALAMALAMALWIGLATAAVPASAQLAAGSCMPEAEALLDAGSSAMDKEHYKDAIAPLEQAVRLCRAANDPANLSGALLEYGKLLDQLNRYAESEAILLEGQALRARIDAGPAPDGDPDHQSMHYAAEMNYLYRQWGRYDLAWKWGDIALAQKAKLIGTNTVSYGTSLSNLSGIALITREYARGLPYAQQAMDTWERTSGTDSTDHAWGMRDVGIIMLAQGNLQGAYYYLERAYRIRLAAFGRDSTETQTSTQDMAAWHTQAGNDTAALAFAEAGLASAVRRFGQDALAVSYALARLARVHLRLGETARAASEAEQVLRIRSKALGPTHVQTIAAWRDVAQIQLANNHLGRSTVAARAAFEACRAIPGGIPASCVQDQLDRAGALLALGQASEALAEADRAASAARTHGQMENDERSAVMLRAHALLTLGRQQDAERALSAIVHDDAAAVHTPAGNQTGIELALDAVRAERAGMDAASIAALAEHTGALAQQLGQQRGISHPSYAAALLDAAALNARGSQHALALRQSARALAISFASRATLLQARAASQMSALAHGEHAVFLGKHSVNALQQARESITALPVEQQHSFVRLKNGAYQQLVDRMLEQRRIGEAEQVLAMVEENEFHDLVRGSQTRVQARQEPADSLREATDGVNGQDDAQDAQDAQDVRIARLRFDGEDSAEQRAFADRVQTLQHAAQAQAEAGAHHAQGSLDGVAELAAARMEMARLLDEATLAWSADAEMHAVPGVTNASADVNVLHPENELGRVGPALAPGRLHLSYFVGEHQLRIVVQHGANARVITLAIGEADLARDIARLRSAAQDPASDPRPQAQRLYQQLLRPVAAELVQARSLTLSLSGVLRYLPFAMLHDGKKWMAERIPVQVSGGAEVKGALPRQPAPRMASMALFGQAQASAELPALPYVAHELQAVSAMRKARHVQSETYLDASFTADALAHALQHDSVVHIASHFVLRPGHDEDSFLLLGNGAKLSVAELAQPRFQFSGLDLLTLSACETAVPAGTDATGRELSSLAWLARERGARYVLASLWRVSDRSTSALMADFYRALEGGASKTAALHQAQLRQIGRLTGSSAAPRRGLKALDAPVANPLRSHPYYWAGFILLGP